MAERFEDLRAWQTARELTNRVYAVPKRGLFSDDWALRDQIRRASISVMSNIADGFERRTKARFVDVLGRAKASAGEIRCQLLVAIDQEYLTTEEFDHASDLADKVSRQLHNLIQYLAESAGAGQVRELPAEYVAR